MKYDNRVFLASSITEFFDLRKQVEDWFVKLSAITKEKNYNIKFDYSSSFGEKITHNGTQDEYNQLIALSNIFILLVGDKLGEFSRLEFDLAYNEFFLKNSPNILVLFRKSELKNKSVSNFKLYLSGQESELNGIKKAAYYYKEYEPDKFNDYNTITLEIFRQIIRCDLKILNIFDVKIKSKKITIDGIEIIDLNNNSEYIDRESVKYKYSQINELKVKIISAIDEENYEEVDKLTLENKKLFSELEVLNEEIFKRIFLSGNITLSSEELSSVVEKAAKFASEGNYFEASNLLSYSHLNNIQVDLHSPLKREELITALLQGIGYWSQIKGQLSNEYFYSNYEYAAQLEINYPDSKFIACNKYFDFLLNNDLYQKMNVMSIKILSVIDKCNKGKSVLEIKEKIAKYYILCLDKIEEGIKILFELYNIYLPLNNLNEIYRISYLLGKGYNRLIKLKEAYKFLMDAYNMIDDVIPNINNIIIKMDICLELGTYYEFINDSKKSISIFTEGINVGLDNDFEHNEKGIDILAKLYYNRGFVYYDKINDYSKVEYDLEEKALPIVLTLYKEDSIKYKKMLADIYFSLGGYYAYLQNSQKAHLYHNKSIKIRESLCNDAENVHIHDLAKNYFYYAAFLASNYDYDKSLEYHEKAYLLYKSLLKQNFLLHAKNAVFAMHFHSGLYLMMLEKKEFLSDNKRTLWIEKIKNILSDALKICNELYEKNPDIIRDYYANICNSYTSFYKIMEKYDIAIYWAKKAIELRIIERQKNPNSEIHKLGEDYLMLGIIYSLYDTQSNNVKLAIDNFLKSKQIFEELIETQRESRAYNLGKVCYELSKIYITINDFASAKENVYQAIELFRYLATRNNDYIFDEIDQCEIIIKIINERLN